MTSRPLLVIGNKNYSSWSLRPWLLLRQFGIDFDERRLVLDSAEFRAEIDHYSPSGRVPVLHHGGLIVWDSLAIAEYINETFLGGRGWPSDRICRAMARSAAAEMHSGFAALRLQLPMNCRRLAGSRAARWDADAERDIQRVLQLWRDLRGCGGEGPFLCGPFGIVDAMFAPVVVRFNGYGVALDPSAAAYCETVRALPAMAEWVDAARNEPEQIAKYERTG